MKNLLNTLSADLQNKLSNFKVYSITVEENEVNVFSEYDLDFSFIQAIEKELLPVNNIDDILNSTELNEMINAETKEIESAGWNMTELRNFALSMTNKK